MFEKLVAARKQPPVPAPEPMEVVKDTAPEKRGRKKAGKRSNPSFVQVGIYLPKSLHGRARQLVFGSDKDFSDVVSDLLSKWVEQTENPGNSV
jgi:hypothetical protein